ncbi:RsiV family protein [Paenibacillus sp. RC67]|uniref:RsiV family protein n=1 Tax=Paenibacillus sp. RC67 TaxID=3039392 RepID=UPI0024AD4B93|nr:RsiV family protein [Paenibacillus sp. RC67]
MNNRLDPLWKEYQEVPIPEELDMIVSKAINRSLKARRYKKVKFKWLAGFAAAAVIFVLIINASTTVAHALSSIPVVDRIIKVLTLKEYVINEPNYNANIKVPSISDLDNKELEVGLNEKYMKENKALYDKFQVEMNDLKKEGDGHLGLDAGYEVKTDNDSIFSIERYVVKSAGSSSEEIHFDTIDKKNQILITLPMLFKDDQFIQVISDNIKEQMNKQMKDDPNKIYWIPGTKDILPTDEFKSIKKDQSFYINNEGKLVIVFNKYEVGPGYMGVAKFIIPTDVLSSNLVSHNYIR